jgi:ribose/xylose/arabinose/galactoside ABC-type transport system permease subunit
MNLLNVHPHVQIIIKGVVTILAVAATLDRSRLEFVK